MFWVIKVVNTGRASMRLPEHHLRSPVEPKSQTLSRVNQSNHLQEATFANLVQVDAFQVVRCQEFDGANLPVSCPQCQPVDSLSARDCAKRERFLADGLTTQNGVNGGVLSQTACRSRASYRQLFSDTTSVLSVLQRIPPLSLLHVPPEAVVALH